MNIYEDERLEEKFNEITDQLGHLLLDFLFITLTKLNQENEEFMEFEGIKNRTKKSKVPF